MDEQKQQLIDRIKQAQNILVTVSANPSVDQLASAIGLTLALNKLDKHGTAVFSGDVPSTIDFLKPEETLEKNTDSLRDFIIALDKTKADKLRYKVEDQVVRIFITPYKTSLSEKDLDFSQGDFNVDVVVALGVTDPAELDSAITAHGRILHDATVVSVSTVGQGSLGTINWVDPTASSLSEMVVNLSDGLDKKLLDSQIATALLTGIVASTERFSNDKTSPKTMSASAELMAAGANQQLIATQLQAPPETPASDDQPQEPAGDQPDDQEPPKPKPEPGTLEIDHESSEPDESDEPDEPAPEPPQPQVHVDENGELVTDSELPAISAVRGGGSDATPSRPLSANAPKISPPAMDEADKMGQPSADEVDQPLDGLTLPSVDSALLTHNESVLSGDENAPTDPAAALPPVSAPDPAFTPPTPGWQPPAAPIAPDTTLTEIEQAVDSPHVHQADAAPAPDQPDHADEARRAIEAAYNHSDAPSDPLQPIAALNAQPLGSDLRSDPALQSPTPSAPAPFTVPTTPAGPAVPTTVPNAGFNEPTPGNTPADDALDMPLPSNPFGPGVSSSTEQFQSPQAFPSNPAPQAPPSAFPGAPQQPGSQNGSQTPPPPVPPPMLPPLQ